MTETEKSPWQIPHWKVAYHTASKELSEESIKAAYNYFYEASKKDKEAMKHLHILSCWVNQLSMIQQDLHEWMENRALALDDQYGERFKKLEQAWGDTQAAMNKILLLMPVRDK